MKKAMLLCALFGALAVSVGTSAADTAELKVAGTVRPAACSLTISGNGIFDYGNIPVSQLSATKATVLAQKQATVSVLCDGAARTALKFSDNRSTSVSPDVATLPYPYLYSFGLGAVNGKKIGAYAIWLSDVKGDGNTYYPAIMSTGNGVSGWMGTSGGPLYISPNNRISAVGYTSSQDRFSYPSFTIVTAVVTIQAAISFLSNLPTTGEIPLDGASTLELEYL